MISSEALLNNCWTLHSLAASARFFARPSNRFCVQEEPPRKRKNQIKVQKSVKQSTIDPGLARSESARSDLAKLKNKAKSRNNHTTKTKYNKQPPIPGMMIDNRLEMGSCWTAEPAEIYAAIQQVSESTNKTLMTNSLVSVNRTDCASLSLNLTSPPSCVFGSPRSTFRSPVRRLPMGAYLPLMHNNRSVMEKKKEKLFK